MRVRKSLAAVAVVALGLAACAQGEAKTEGEPATGYVLLSADAQHAGYSLEAEGTVDPRLPVAVAAGQKRFLVGPGGPREVTVGADEMVYVHGAHGEITRGKLDHDVARDRIGVGGTKHGAEALAARVEGVVDHHEGHAIVVGPDVLAMAARGAAPAGLVELVPVMPGERTGTPAFPSVAASLPALAFAPTVTPVAAQAVATGSDLSDEQATFLAERLGRGADRLLPAAVSCNDPVAGVWISREHFPGFTDWYQFELSIARDMRDPTRLVGHIVSRSWSGEREATIPGACSSLAVPEHEPAFDWTVRMTATGTFEGGKLAFDGAAPSPVSTRCGPQMTASRYNADHFTGTVLADGRHLDAHNNDGGRSVDEHHLFRRVACAPK